MKKLTSIMVIVSMLVFCSATVFAVDAESQFKETYDETGILTGELFDGVSKALSEEAPGLGTLLPTIDKLVTNSQTLEKLAGELDKKDAAKEAGHMIEYLTRIKQVIQTGEEQHELEMHLARYYLHFSNCVMMNPFCLKEILHDYVEELKEVLEKNDIHEAPHIAQHLHFHADQMYYSAQMFRKKVWQKFSNQIEEIAEDIFEAAEKGDTAAVQAEVEKIEKPVAMLRKLVKE